MDHVDRIVDQWRRERADLDVGPMETIGRIKRLSLHLSREMEKTFAAHGLNAAGFDVLATLRRSGAPYRLSAGDLVDWTMVTSGTLTHRIIQLEKAGLVVRVRNPEDGRGVLIALTDEGYRKIEAAITDHVATQKRLISGLSAADNAQLDTLLAAFLKGFER